MTDNLTVADVLERAANLIEPEGAWMQDDFSNALGATVEKLRSASCWCIAGAIGNVAGLDGPDAEMWLIEHGDLFTGIGDHFGVIGWNDEQGRTQPEVVVKMREAASIAREKGL